MTDLEQIKHYLSVIDGHKWRFGIPINSDNMHTDHIHIVKEMQGTSLDKFPEKWRKGMWIEDTVTEQEMIAFLNILSLAPKLLLQYIEREQQYTALEQQNEKLFGMMSDFIEQVTEYEAEVANGSS